MAVIMPCDRMMANQPKGMEAGFRHGTTWKDMEVLLFAGFLVNVLLLRHVDTLFGWEHWNWGQIQTALSGTFPSAEVSLAMDGVLVSGQGTPHPGLEPVGRRSELSV